MNKAINKSILPIFLLGLILIIYFLFRLPNLTSQPIFADEAIYIRWAQIAKSEPTLRFISLQDGKTPLFMWILMPAFKIFNDPLFAGRILSIIAGLGTLSAAFLIGWKFFNLKVGIWSGFLIAITPFIVFFDRMALVDSMLSAFSLWSLFLSLMLVKYRRLDLAMILGFSLGGGLLTKTPAMFTVLSVPISILTFNFKDKKRTKNLIILFLLWLVAFGIGLAIYNALRLGPGFENLSSRNQDYIFAPTRIIESPLDPLIPHFNDITEWFPKMITLPIMVAILGGIILIGLKRNLTALAILGWSIFPLVTEMFLLRTFTTRYILFTIPPLLILGAYFIDFAITNLRVKVRKEYLVIATLVLILPLTLNFNLRMLFDPFTTPLPRESRSGYFEEWTAGYGFPEIAAYLENQAAVKPIVVGTEGSFGTLPDGLYIYLDKTPNISIVGGKSGISDQLKKAALEHPTFYVANKERLPSPDPDLRLIKEYPKAVAPDGTQDAIVFYQLLPNEEFRSLMLEQEK